MFKLRQQSRITIVNHFPWQRQLLSCLGFFAVFSAYILLATPWGCSESANSSLLVTAREPGTFELYRYDKNNHLTAEWRAQFNQKIDLPAGRYLLLKSCSSHELVVAKNENRIIRTRIIRFQPSASPMPGDKFVIECRRKIASTYDHQRLENQFEMTLFDDQQEILVNMRPLSNVLAKPLRETSEDLNVPIGGVRVNTLNTGKDQFFVYPKDPVSPTTNSQYAGHWMFLLPGAYTVELNGSKQDITLADGQLIDIQSGQIRIQSALQLDTERATKISGRPLEATLNKTHTLTLNTDYALLPGEHHLTFSGAQTDLSFQLAPAEKKTLPVRSVSVRLNCAEADWGCLGKKEVFLFEPDAIYPFASGTTDVPIVFWQKNVTVSLAGLESIRHRLPASEQNIVLRTRQIKLLPNLKHEEGYRTELLRIESAGENPKGVSFDLPIGPRFSFTVLQGAYRLSSYRKVPRSTLPQRVQLNFYASPSHEPLILKPNINLSLHRLSEFQK